MILDGDKTYKALKKKGFIDATNKSKDHKWLEFWYEGKLTTIKTKFSHNDQELNNYLIKQISTQIHLNKEQFKEYVSCSISEEQYIEIVKEHF